MAANEEETVAVLAAQFGMILLSEHLAETAAAWRVIRPHLERVRAAELGAEVEPAPFFRP